MFNIWHDRAFRSTVRSQFVSDHPFGHGALLPQKIDKQTLRGLGIALFLKNFTEHMAVLINGAPQIIVLALDHDHHFIQKPDIGSAGFLSPQLPDIS
ncbi:hypothetical protein [Pseudovibrio sp. Tun.PSC04-5.I4]|uniref:hypothetical protein n=1 Tax=Pseudovibrio sp. Tun.PSC04-5.I4 TaxID=1798213 RepID=UPI000B82680C